MSTLEFFIGGLIGIFEFIWYLALICLMGLFLFTFLFWWGTK